jgi:HEAT repeat protein
MEPQINPEAVKKACARVVVKGGSSGSGYLVHPEWVVTCQHVVAGVPEGRQVRLYFPAGQTRAGKPKFVKRWATVGPPHATADCALLQLEKRLTAVAPVRLGKAAALHDSCWTYGFPPRAGEHGIPVISQVIDPEGHNREGQPAVILYAPQLPGMEVDAVEGLSGAPVVAGNGVIGHVMNVSLNTRAEGASLKALEELLEPIVPDGAKRGSLAEILRGLHGQTRSQPVQWALLFACPVRLVRSLLPDEVAQAPLLGGLRDFLQREIDWILRDAGRRLGRPLPDWQSLDALFVPPTLACGRRPRQTQDELDERERRRGAGDHRDEPEEEQPRQGKSGDEVRKVVDWPTLRQGLEELVVLGDPGYGKTMLLWHEVAHRCRDALGQADGPPARLDRLPLAAFLHALPLADRLAGQTGPPSFLDAVLSCLADRHGLDEDLQEFLRSGLADGTCLLAVDALDEVPPGPRKTLLEALEDFTRRAQGAKLLLSSRLVGYGRAPFWATKVDPPPLPGEKPSPPARDEPTEAEILAFDAAQMEKAVRAWFTGDSHTRELFWGRIAERWNVFDVLRCPLLLRLACQSAEEARRGSKPLPLWNRRGELYETFVRDAVTRWADRVSPPPAAQQRELFPRFAGFVAGRLWLQDSRRTLWEPAGVAEVIDKARKRYPALASRPDLLQDLYDTGILVRAGPDQPGTPLLFSHRTLGEYLAAGYLARRLAKPRSKLWGRVEEIAWLPDWEPVVVFLAGQLADPVPLLRRLADPGTDDYFRHRFGLAGQCLEEIPRGRLAGCQDLVNQITEEVFTCWLAHCRKGRDEAVKHLSRAFRGLTRAGGQIHGRTVLDWLGDTLAEGTDAFRATQVVAAIGSEAATPPLVARLQEMLLRGDEITRYRATVVLGELGSRAAGPEILEGLAGLLEHGSSDSRFMVRFAVARFGRAAATAPFLRKLLDLAPGAGRDLRPLIPQLFENLGAAVAIPEVLDRLLEMLRSSQQNLQITATEILRHLGTGAAREEMVEALGDLLITLDQRVVYPYARDALRAFGAAAARPGFIGRLTRMATAADWVERSAAAQGIAACGPPAGRTDLLDVLARLLDDRQVQVLGAAVYAVGAFGPAAARADVLAGLGRLLAHPNLRIARDAAETLGQIGPAAATPSLLDTLASLLRRGNAVKVQDTAAEAVESLGPAAARADVLEGLADAISNCDDAFVSFTWRAVRRLGHQAATGPFIARLAELLAHEYAGVREAAARAVEALGSAAAHPAVLNGLVKLLADEVKNVSSAAARAIGSMGADIATPDFLGRLAAMLGAEGDYHVRWGASWAVSQLGSRAACPEILDRLKANLQDENIWIAGAAVLALESMGSRAAREDIVNLLLDFLPGEELGDMATTALIAFGGDAARPDVLDRLGDHLLHAREFVQVCAIRVIHGMGACAARADIVDRLIRIGTLGSKSWRTSEPAAKALTRMTAEGVRVFGPPEAAAGRTTDGAGPWRVKHVW